jgi:hypothetical protein
VVYITQRAELLASALYLGALLLRGGAHRPRRSAGQTPSSPSLPRPKPSSRGLRPTSRPGRRTVAAGDRGAKGLPETIGSLGIATFR